MFSNGYLNNLFWKFWDMNYSWEHFRIFCLLYTWYPFFRMVWPVLRTESCNRAQVSAGLLRTMYSHCTSPNWTVQEFPWLFNKNTDSRVFLPKILTQSFVFVFLVWSDHFNTFSKFWQWFWCRWPRWQEHRFSLKTNASSDNVIFKKIRRLSFLYQ